MKVYEVTEMKWKKGNSLEEELPQMREHKYHPGLRAKIIAGVMVPLIVVLILVGVFLSEKVTLIVEELKTTDIASQTQAAAKQTELYMETFMSTSKMMCSLDTVESIFAEVEAQDASFDIRQAEHFTPAMAELKEIYNNFDKGLQGSWLVFFKNSTLILSDGFVSDDSWVATEQSWYPSLLNSNGKTILTSVYIGDSTGKPTVSIMSGVYNNNGEMIGAAGLDISLDELEEQLSQITIGKEGYVAVYDSSQNIAYHPDSELLLKNMSEVGYSDALLTPLSNHETMDNIVKYQQNSVDYYGNTTYLDDLDWQIVGCMTADEFTQEEVYASHIVFVAFALCILLLVAICILLANTIVRPLKKLDAVAAQLAKGDLDVEVNATSHDEVGALANNIALVVARLKTYIAYIDEISDVLEDFGRGNLKFELKQAYVGEFNRLKVAMNHIQEALSTTLFRIVDAAVQVDSSTNQIANAAQAMAQGATEQASSVEELAATINDIDAKIRVASEDAATANRFTQEAEQGIIRSNEFMDNLMTAMNDIQHSSDEINKIIKNIDDIAFQTNILALNAAVEAARAGSAGKGFAVVADEVRNLAAKSAESAQLTTTLIENSMRAVEVGMQHATATSEAMQQVAEKSAVTAEKMQELSVTTAEQAAAIAQITTGIEQIASVTQTNSATAEETAASSEELSGQAQLMKELTAQFHMDERFHQ